MFLLFMCVHIVPKYHYCSYNTVKKIIYHVKTEIRMLYCILPHITTLQYCLISDFIHVDKYVAVTLQYVILLLVCIITGCVCHGCKMFWGLLCCSVGPCRSPLRGLLSVPGDAQIWGLPVDWVCVCVGGVGVGGLVAMR